MSNRLNQWNRHAGRTAAGAALRGGVIWLVWMAVAWPGRTPALLMLSPFVLAPLVLEQAQRDTSGDQRLIRWVERAGLVCAIAAALSFVPEQGALAAALTVPWLACTLMLALAGALRLLGRKRIVTPKLGIDLALGFVAVGGSWLTISRLGANPLGFNDPIVQLTAVHFHFAGFALPAVTGRLAQRWNHQGHLVVAVAVGIVATAIGITAGGLAELVGATTMALIGLVVAALLLRTAAAERAVTRALCLTAGLSLAGGMVMALIWAWTVWLGVRGPGLDLMVATHGSLNALGFGFIGLLAVRRLGPATDPNPPVNAASEQPRCDPDGFRMLVLGRPTRPQLADLLNAERHAPLPFAAGVLQRPDEPGWRRERFERRIEHGDRDRAIRAMVAWAGHHHAGIARVPNAPAIDVGARLAIAIPVGPITVTAVSLIVDVIDEPDRFGFVYATLPHHPMRGEEAFIIEGHGEDLRIVVNVAAVAEMTGARVLPPVTRWLQRRALGRYLEGIATADVAIDVTADGVRTIRREPLRR